MIAYYNEIDPFAISWLKNLIKAGLIAAGDVDDRSIEDVKPDDLRNYTQCHFFAGIGVWSYALLQAKWPDDYPVWTGSCPCQPFSAAGKRKGTADERHLWPALDYLIGQCQPATFFGEQVASKDGLAWFDTVQADLESKAYSVGAVDLCAAGFGAPHIRQRLYFVAESLHAKRRSVLFDRKDGCNGENDGREEAYLQLGTRSEVLQLANSDGWNSSTEEVQRSRKHGFISSNSRRWTDGQKDEGGRGEKIRGSGTTGQFWAKCDWLPCQDGKQRPVEPGTFPLAHGVTNRVGRLRGYGNSLVAPVAQAFIEAYLDLHH